MAGKLFSGEGAGVLDILLPLGLGVAAAAHPALARGASAISSSMAAAGRNRRLREVVEMEKAREGRAVEQYEYAKSRRPVKEARESVGGTLTMPGGGVQQIDYGTGQPTLRTIRPPYSPEYQEAVKTGQGLETQGAVEKQQAMMPGRLKEFGAQQDMMLQRQLQLRQQLKALGLDTTGTITPMQAFGARERLINEMKAKVAGWRQMMKDQYEDITPELEEKFVRQVHADTEPAMRWIEQHIQGIQPYEMYENIPQGYVRSKYPTNGAYIWFDPMDLSKPPFIPKRPYSGSW